MDGRYAIVAKDDECEWYHHHQKIILGVECVSVDTAGDHYLASFLSPHPHDVVRRSAAAAALRGSVVHHTIIVFVYFI